MSDLHIKYRPTKLSQVVGQPNAVRVLRKYLDTKTLPHVLMFAGPSGCLRADTPIYDPVENSTLTVYARWTLGRPFHVLSSDASGAVVVALAGPPQRFAPERMFHVETLRSSFVVTGGHRVLLDTGRFVSVDHLYNGRRFSSCRLPSIADADLEVLRQGGLRWTQTGQDSQDDYRPGFRSGDGRLLSDRGGVLSLPLLPADVRGRNRCCWRAGGSDDGLGHSRICPSCAPRSNTRFSGRSWPRDASASWSSSESSLRLSRSGQAAQRLLCANVPSDKVGRCSYPVSESLPASARVSRSDHGRTHLSASLVPLALNCSQATWTTIKNISPAGQEEYYDFYVPVYNNYWCGDCFHHNTGKTTLAGIVADRLCKKDLFSYVELDCAASPEPKRMVEKVIERCQYGSAKPQVHVWDEFQSLSRAGFTQQACLRLFEPEKAGNNYHVLCTTDPSKIIPTVRSRAEVIKTELVRDSDLGALLTRVALQEGVTLSEGAKERVVELAMGSPRRALVLLGKVEGVPPGQQLAALGAGEEGGADAISLFRALINPHGTWKKVAEVLRGLKSEDPERLRRLVTSCCTTTILKGGRLADRAALISQAFREPVFVGFDDVVCMAYDAMRSS